MPKKVTKKSTSKKTNNKKLKSVDEMSEKQKYYRDNFINAASEENRPVSFKYDEDSKRLKPDYDNPELDDADFFFGKLADHYGVTDPTIANALLCELAEVSKYDGGDYSDAININLSLVKEINPQDATEAMLANQMVAIHKLIQQSARNALVNNQTYQGLQLYLREINKLSKTYIAQLQALDKHRGKGQQKMTVEHVHVSEGGQAIIGNVEHGKTSNDGGNKKNEQ